jgi:hypothetical protein
MVSKKRKKRKDFESPGLSPTDSGAIGRPMLKKYGEVLAHRWHTNISEVYKTLKKYAVILVGAVGIEPTTLGLKGLCSTTELRP